LDFGSRPLFPSTLPCGFPSGIIRNLSFTMEDCRAGRSESDEEVQWSSPLPKPPWWRAADKQAAAMEDCRVGRESDMRCSKK
jgi:hypothetical protein